MIITITCNPAIDKTVYENKTVFDIGGKGINVSKVLKSLKVDSMATGFLGKENGKLVIDDLNKNKIENHFIEIDGSVRTNTKYINDGKLIEENEIGPTITEDDKNRLFEYVSTFENDIVIISGSVSGNSDNNIYKDLINILKKRNNYVILDCSKQLLKNAIEAKPDIIKPNKQEICELFSIKYDEKEIIDRCKKLGIDFICLSLAEEGAIFICDQVYKIKPLIKEISSNVGAGDAMVAALAYGRYKALDTKQTIKLAMATSLAACQTEGTKPPIYENIMNIYKEIAINDKIRV